jgi:hypothetical protein
MYWSEDLQEEINYPTDITVIEEGEPVEPTGLIDHNGDDICRVKDPIGFVHYDD